MPINPKKRPAKDASVLSTRQSLLLLFLGSCLATFFSMKKVNHIFPSISRTIDLEHVLDAPTGFGRKLGLESPQIIGVTENSSLSLTLPNINNEWNTKDQINLIQSESQPFTPPTKYFAWTNSTTIPTWLKDYFQWHHHQRSLLNEASYRNDTHNVNHHRFKFLVMTCFRDELCGGVTDRLRPVLTLLRAAQLSNRILLIYWERPHALEEFLVPHNNTAQFGGFNWSLPSYMIPDVRERTAYHNWKPFYADPHNEKRILNSVYQSWDYGWLWYNEHLSMGEPPAMEVFRDVWNVVFQMAPPVQALFDATFHQMNLESGAFATAHIRALYAIDSRPHSQTVALVRNALNCASQLRPGGPFLVASDLLDALQEAKVYGRERNVTVVTPPYTHEPLHVGLHNDSLTVPSDFYTAFVDIYLLAQSRCVAVGPGGYGYWAQVLGHNHTCWMRHSGERSKTCEWRNVGDAVPTEITDGTTNDMITIPNNLPRSPINIWNHNHTDNSPTMVPEWLKDYFEWHQEERAKLTPENFMDHRYVIMTCLRGAKCGGMTDRLRPILTHLKVAHMSSRLLFIYWERPFPLEEFLLPPKGGFDWRLPSFILPELQKTQQSGALEVRRFQKKEPMIVSTMYQSWHYGELLYNNEYKGEDEPDAMVVFRDVWNVVFTPSPPVAKLIYESFDAMGIRPGHYATAHVRALYAIKARGTSDTDRMVKNAMNCASQLFPGGPFMVVSDSAEAIKLAEEYGAYRKVTVVAPPYDEQPLHLGLHNESDPSIVASHFYNVFSDMYLIAETRCMVVGKGGFGRWGILLGHDPDCNAFSSGFKAQDCDWKEAAPSDSKSTGKELESAKRPVGEVPIFREPMAYY